MKHLATSLLAAMLVANAAAAPAHLGALPAGRPAWQPTWISSPQPLWGEDWVAPLGLPTRLSDVTLRQVVTTSLGGERLRLVVSNEYGSSALQLGRMTIRAEGGGEAVAVRFQGRDAAVVVAGARAISDPVALATAAGQRLQVDLHLPQATALAGFHWGAREQTLILPGDAVGRRDAAAAQTSTARGFVTELLVEATDARGSVVTLGDSITDGNGATIGADQRWPDHLARRLAPLGVAVLNAGISGNRLLSGGWGDSALARFERDVLRHRGVRAAIVLLGTNDIGLPGSPFSPGEAPVALDALKLGMRQLVEQAHARGVRVVVGTLPPFEDALKGTPLEGHYSPRKEAQRQAFNAWLRGGAGFDAVVDFDAVLRDPARPSRLRADLDSGDHLHPGDTGYRRMAEALDLAAILGTEARELQP